MIFNRHSVLVFVAISLLLGGYLLRSYWQTIWQAPTQSASIAVSKSPLSAPFYIADKKGFFKRHCSKVSIVDVVGGNNAFNLMIKGETDFATSSGSVLVYRAFQRDDFTAIATFVQSDNDVKFVSLENKGISRGLDFKNKKIGVVEDSASEYFLSTYLALDGLKLSDVHTVSFSPDALPKALINGEVDVIVPWEPYAYESMKAANGMATVLSSKNLYTLTFNLVARKERLAAKNESATCILKSLKNAIEFIASQPEDAKQIIKEKLALDDGFIDWVWQDYIFKLGLNQSLILSLEAQANWVIKSEPSNMHTLPNFELYIDSSLLKQFSTLSASRSYP